MNVSRPRWLTAGLLTVGLLSAMAARSVSARPLPSLDSYIDSPHFRIHYSTSGSNMIYGRPNTACRDSVVLACERCWSYIHTTHGWQIPPPDDPSGGGSNLIDCNVDECPDVKGILSQDGPAPGYPGGWTAHSTIDHDYSLYGFPDPTGIMQTAVAHYYFEVVYVGITTANPWPNGEIGTVSPAPRDDGRHYPDGQSYPALAYDRLFTTFPQIDQHPTQVRCPEATGCSVQRFDRDSGSSDDLLEFVYDGPACTQQVMLIAKQAGASLSFEYPMALDGNGHGTASIIGWDGMEYAYLLVTMKRECGPGTFDFTFGANVLLPTGIEEPGSVGGSLLQVGEGQPNPFVRATEVR